MPLLLDTDGARMAKRKGSLTLTALREAGVKPERVVGLLAFTLGLTEKPLESHIDDFTETFKLSDISRKAFGLEENHLAWLYES